MRRLLCLALIASLPGPAIAQTDCSDMNERADSTPGWAALVMQPPVLGETVLTPGALAARRNLVLAHQPITIRPLIRYLAAPIRLANEEGRDLAHNVPLERGAPISAWRSPDGVKLCSIGWQNGLFGGVANDGHMRWVCLEDRDRDGSIDNAWRPFSRSMGLSFNRLDIPVSPPVALLDAQTGDAAVRTNRRTTLDGYELHRAVVVTRIEANMIRIESRMGETGRGARVAMRELPLDAPGQATLSGVTVAVVPGGGGATVEASGAFTGADVRHLCQGARVKIGEFDVTTEFGFPNW